MLARHVIGIDLDNTLVCYDELFHSVAREQNLIGPELPKSKEKIRNAIRLLPDGEQQWTRLQAMVYGPKMSAAQMFEGADVFLRHCTAGGIRPCIVSHKSRRAAQDDEVDLHEAALQWLAANGFFTELALTRGDVFFEPTRADKITRIRDLHCSHFIDDLDEVFDDDEFPRETTKLLFAPHGTSCDAPGLQVFRSWHDLDRYFFP